MSDFDLEDMMAAGTGYALFRHGQDRQTEQLVRALREPVEVEVVIDERGDPPPSLINALEFTTTPVEDWDDYVGQEPLKTRLMTHIIAAMRRNEALPHVLLASGYPGVGKTSMARLIALAMGKQIIEIVPPFNVHTLAEAAEMLDDGDILFIDEIHKLTDTGVKGAEILLKILEDKVVFLPNGDVIRLNDITIIGATTDVDKLPETVIDRFKIKPYFQPYKYSELARIAVRFAYRHASEMYVDDDMAVAMAYACRGTPRILEEMVLAVRDLAGALRRNPTPDEMLEFLEVQPDGLTRQHIQYLTTLRRKFGRTNRYGETEYLVGAQNIQEILRETPQGIGRIERLLVERDLITRTARGRQLTAQGIERAEELM
jgi:holliday junction DNA helicase RuvB